jgi:hypothetical protein
VAAVGDDYTIKVKLVLEDVERKLIDAVKKVQPVVKESFLGVLDIFAPELSVILDSVRAQARQVLESVRMWRKREEAEQREEAEAGRREEETFLERMQRRLGVERVAAAAAGAAPAGAAAAGGAAGGAALVVIAIQAVIQLIKQILEYLRKMSPLLGGVFKLIETSIMLFVKPLADFVGYLLKPIVMLLLRFFILPFYRTIMPTIVSMGKVWDEIFTNFMRPIMPILKEAAEIIGNVLPILYPIIVAPLLAPLAAILGVVTTISATIKAIKDAAEWIWEKIKWLADKLGGFFGAIGGFAAGALGGIFGFQWGGLVPMTGLYRLHAGERVVPAGAPAQTIFIYPRIEIGAVNMGDARDMARLEERINRAIADALRRRY